ncbi:MAG: insulinase family protein [Gammaproteobacteria bacterium]|nr:insulinase family protein [Gammaproteobacteria bacterium]
MRWPTSPAGETAGPADPVPDRFHEREYTGYADEPLVAVLALTDGFIGDDYYAHALLEHLLDNWLYERLRLDTALTYTPDAGLYVEADWGIFSIEAETETNDQREALDQIEALVARLTEAPLPEEEFHTAQLSLLRHWARSVETNEGFADYYIGSLPDYDHHSRFVNDEFQLAILTPQALHRAARRLFAPENLVYVRDDDRQAVINAE